MPYWSDRLKITLKTDLVLELVDNFTNQLIQPCRLSFFINERPAKTTRNKNGLMVFCNLMDTPRKIRIESDLYQSLELSLTEDEVNQHASGKFVHRLVRVEPSKRYSIPKWGTVIEGTINKVSNDDECTYEAVVLKVSDVFRIKKTSEDNQHAAIHKTNSDIMIGRKFYESDGHPSEAFMIIGKVEDNFAIEPEVKKPLEAHSILHEVRHVRVEKNGHFMIVYPNVTDTTASFKLFKNKEVIGEFQIEAGKWNDLGVLNT